MTRFRHTCDPLAWDTVETCPACHDEGVRAARRVARRANPAEVPSPGLKGQGGPASDENERLVAHKEELFAAIELAHPLILGARFGCPLCSVVLKIKGAKP